MFAPFTKSVAPGGSVVTFSSVCGPPPPVVAHAASPTATTATQTPRIHRLVSAGVADAGNHMARSFAPYSWAGMP